MENSEAIIKKIFQKLSINTFVNYYSTFRMYKDSSSNKKIIETFISNAETWTSKAMATRASEGKRIFQMNLELKSLEYIINSANSNKLSSELIDKAKSIYYTINRPALLKVSNLSGDYSIETLLMDLEINRIEKNELLTTEEKKALVKIRLGQSFYRRDLLELWGGCSVSGCSNHILLIASHIKPYSKCDHSERYDKFNGLLLTPNYDKLFDKNLISFNSEGLILISKNLSSGDLEKMHISTNDRILNLKNRHKKYLDHHRVCFEELEKG